METIMQEQYKKLVSTILTTGELQSCRNGRQLIIPTYSFTLDFKTQSPKLTLRKMSYKGVKGEFDTLIDDVPLTNVSQFEANGCNYWKLWGGEDGELRLDYADMLKPQLKPLINQIKTDHGSRRHVIELWNHENISDLSLPCCWHGLTFSVILDTVHLKWVQRSVDTMIGLPADIYLAYLFMALIAEECNLKIGTCMFALSNVHIYEEHISNASILLERTSADIDNPLSFELKS